MFRKNLTHKAVALAMTAAVFASCKKDPVEPETPPAETPSYTVPATYDFGTSVNYKTSETRISMLKEFITYIRSTHTSTAHVNLEQSKLYAYYENTGSPFASAELNSSGINLKDKVSNTYGQLSEMNIWLPEAAAASQTTVEASKGAAGKVLGPVPATGIRSAWLINGYGFEFKELVEKGIMGSVMYNEAMQRMKLIDGYDNATTLDGGGTAMERAWDEAFGYFGVPVSFPTTTTGLSYWGNYCNSVNPAIGSNKTIMDAFLKGRAAISNKDYAVRDAQRDIVVSTWDMVAAAKLIAYLKQGKTNIAETGLRSHALSEAYGFIRAFRYNHAKKISDADINTLLDLLGNNLYDVTADKLTQAINLVAGVYGIDANKL
jgi:hypothetical protein